MSMQTGLAKSLDTTNGSDKGAEAAVRKADKPLPFLGRLIVPLNGRELDQVTKGISAKETGPVRNRNRFLDRTASLDQEASHGVDILHFQTQVTAGRILNCVFPKEMQFLIAQLKPDQVQSSN